MHAPEPAECLEFLFETIEVAMDNILKGILLCGTMGLVGQGVRAVIGLGSNNPPAGGQASQQTVFNASYLFISLVIGAIAGILAGMGLNIVSSVAATPDSATLLGLMSAGYAGTDFIENTFAKLLPDIGAAQPQSKAPGATEGTLQKVSDHLQTMTSQLTTMVAVPAVANAKTEIRIPETQICGIDSLMPCSPAALMNAQSPDYLGSKPQFWGRYFYAPCQINSSGHRDSHYSAEENSFLYKQGIRLAPIARQTGNVGGTEQQGREDAFKNVQAIFEVFPVDYLYGANQDVLVFLDVEDSAPLSKAYYVGWSSAIVDSARQISGEKRVNFYPAIYAGPKSNVTWNAVAAALAEGATCAGSWMARYYFGDPKPRSWRDDLVTPNNGSPCPILAWQYWASANNAPPDLNFDNSIANPAHSAMLLSRLVAPPP